MEYTNGLFISYWEFLGQIISGFSTPVLLVKYNINRDQKKPVSTVFIHGNEITQKIDVCMFAFIQKYTILAVTLEASVNGKHSEWTDALL